MALPIGQIDHVAYPVRDLPAMAAFLARALDARSERAPHRIDGIDAVLQLNVGGSLLSLHRDGNGIALAGRDARPGCLDICIRWNAPIEAAVTHLDQAGIAVEEGPVRRVAANGEQGQSIYFRDPDGNLFELLSTMS
jgi:catechol 2,3-dioxygenase-like lactoylglutathione lyase family enzyme